MLQVYIDSFTWVGKHQYSFLFHSDPSKVFLKEVLPTSTKFTSHQAFSLSKSLSIFIEWIVSESDMYTFKVLIKSWWISQQITKL